MSKRRERESVQADAGGKGSVTEERALAVRHLRWGWWSLLLFLTMGIVLEGMHGLKIDWYLNVAHETRRLMWTLAHAHGVLLALVNLGFAMTLRLFTVTGTAATAASYALRGATVLLPGGFLLGGIQIYGGDPGRGILLVPAGAGLLFFGVLVVAWRVQRGT